eukprot:UN23419
MDSGEVSKLQNKVHDLQESRQTLQLRLEEFQNAILESNRNAEAAAREKRESRMLQKTVAQREHELAELRNTLHEQTLKTNEMKHVLVERTKQIEEKEIAIRAYSDRENRLAQKLVEHQINLNREASKRKQLESENRNLRQAKTDLHMEINS